MSQVKSKFMGILKRQIYSLTLINRIFMNALDRQRWPWWNQIDDDIILGGIPLKNKGHVSTIITELGVQAVLSLNETFELRTRGLFSVPVSPEEWIGEGIEHLHIETPDFCPLTLEDINRGVEFVSEQVANKRKVYVHCKAGRGRSATIVICYLMKTKQVSPDSALIFVKGKRPLTKPNARQMESIRKYHQSYC